MTMIYYDFILSSMYTCSTVTDEKVKNGHQIWSVLWVKWLITTIILGLCSVFATAVSINCRRYVQTLLHIENFKIAKKILKLQSSNNRFPAFRGLNWL